MEKLQCKNCEGNLEKINGKYVCRYCGTEYKMEHTVENPFKLEIIKPGCRVIKSGMMMTNEFFKHIGEEESIEIAKRDCARKLAEFIYNNFDELVDFKMDEHYENMTKVFLARMRVYEKGAKDETLGRYL